MLSLASALDYEPGPRQYNVTISATNPNDNTLSATSTLIIDVTDVNEVPALTLTPATVTISEAHVDVIPGVTLSKLDPDVSDGQTIVYSIQSTSPINGPFTVTNAATGT